ncbi:MAG: DUF2878 domain-containing protein [Burkholderiaceae bacterium]
MWINFILSQAGWFAGVLSAARGMPWLGALAMVAVLVIHLARAPLWRREAALLLIAMVVGFVWETLLVQTGVLSYLPQAPWPQAVAPYWIVLLWALFATLLNVTMRWLHGRLLLAALLGAVGGPLSFWAGVRMGAVTLTSPFWSTLVLACGWALLTPLLVASAQRLDGFAAAN